MMMHPERKHVIFLLLLLVCLTLIPGVTFLYGKISSEHESSLNEQRFTWLANNTTWHQSGSSSGWAGYDRVYFIALPQRLHNVQEVASKLGIANSAWILKAIHKDHLNFKELIKLKMLDKRYFGNLKPERYGRIGCHLSHLAVLLHCFTDKSVNTCVVFEDDLRLPDDNTTTQISIFQKEYEKLNLPWDMVYLDFCYGQPEEVIDANTLKLKGCGCMHAYAIKKDAFPKIFKMLNPMRFEIDRGISNNMLAGKIYAIGPTNPIYFQQDRTKFGTTLDAGFIEHKEIIPKFQDH